MATVRKLKAANELSAEAKAEIKDKKVPIPFSNNAPKIKGKSGEDIREFFVTCDWLFDNADVTEQGTKMEMAAFYAGHEQRTRWQRHPDYEKGVWADFKESILTSYSKGKNDPEYAPSDLKAALEPYISRPVNNKQYWEAFQREVLHILQALITSGEVTNKGAIEHIKASLTEGIWHNVLGDLRQEALKTVAAGTTPTYDFTLDQVAKAVSNYFLTDKWVSGPPPSMTFSRDLVPVSTSRVKTEELDEYLNRIASLQDVIQKGEKDREESRKNDQKLLTAVLESLQRTNLQGLRSQGYVQETSNVYLQAPTNGVSFPTNLPNGVYKAPPGAIPPGNKFVVNDGRCYFCRDLGHIVANCPVKEMCETQGHIFKPGGTNIFHLPNGQPIQRTNAKQPLSPWDQVQKYQQENATKVSAFQSQEDEFAAESSVYQQESEFSAGPFPGFGRA